MREFLSRLSQALDTISEGDDYQKHKEWRRKNKDKVAAQNKRAREKGGDEYKKKRAAHQKVHDDVKKGKKDKPKKCANCGASGSGIKLQGNHSGYDGEKKTEVRWLCPKCHPKSDGRTGKDGKISKGMKNAS